MCWCAVKKLLTHSHRFGKIALHVCSVVKMSQSCSQIWHGTMLGTTMYIKCARKKHTLNWTAVDLHCDLYGGDDTMLQVHLSCQLKTLQYCYLNFQKKWLCHWTAVQSSDKVSADDPLKIQGPWGRHHWEDTESSGQYLHLHTNKPKLLSLRQSFVACSVANSAYATQTTPCKARENFKALLQARDVIGESQVDPLF